MTDNIDSTPELLNDPDFKLFFNEINDHYDALSRLPLPEQRKLDAEFIRKHSLFFEPVFHIVNLEILGAENNKIPLRIYDTCPDHYFLTKDAMKFFWNMYALHAEQYKNPYASLDYGSAFNHLPPALIIKAEYDPLSFDIDRYAVKLRQAGAYVIEKTFAKLIHGFLYIPLYDQESKIRWTKEIKDYLHELGIG